MFHLNNMDTVRSKAFIDALSVLNAEIIDMENELSIFKSKLHNAMVKYPLLIRTELNKNIDNIVARLNQLKQKSTAIIVMLNTPNAYARSVPLNMQSVQTMCVNLSFI